MRKILEFIKSADHVERFHTVRKIQSNTVAAHSFGVAWFCYLIEEGECSRNLLLAALSHDLPEIYFGDMPSPTKKFVAEKVDFKSIENELLQERGLFFALTDFEQSVLKIADLLDGLFFCATEIQLGNNSRNLRGCFSNYRAYISECLEDAKLSYSVCRIVRELVAEIIGGIDESER